MNPAYVNPAPLLTPAEQARAVAANLVAGNNAAINQWLGGDCPVQPAAPPSSIAALTMQTQAKAMIPDLQAMAVGTLTCLVTVPGCTTVFTTTFNGRKDFDSLRAFLANSPFSMVTLQDTVNDNPDSALALRLAEIDYLRAVLEESGAALPATTSLLDLEDTVQPPNGSAPDIEFAPTAQCETSVGGTAVAAAETHDYHIYADNTLHPDEPQGVYPITSTPVGEATSVDGGD